MPSCLPIYALATGRMLVQLQAWMNRWGLMLAGQVAVR